MTTAALVKAIRRYWYVLLIGVVVCAGVTWLITPANIGTKPSSVNSYTATATLVVDYSAASVTTGQQVPMARIVLYVTTGEVPEKAAKKLGYKGAPAVLAASMTVAGDSAAGALTISSTADSAETAEARANAFAEEAVAYFKASKQDGMPKLTVLQSATAIPNVSKNTVVLPPSRIARAALGGVVGLVLALALALILSHFDSRLRTREEVHRAMHLPVVGEVPRLPRGARGRREITVVDDPLSPFSDSFRAVRAAITHVPGAVEDALPARRSVDDGPAGDGARVVLVTSGHADDGKTTSVANLAASFAETGMSVLVLDADVRKPDLHERFDVPQGSGMSDYVVSHGQASIHSLIRPTKVPGVRLITAGSRLEHPETLPARFGPLFAEAREQADIILVDAAPILAANDVFDLLPLVDTVLVVVRSGRLTENSSGRIAELLGRFQVPVTGVVLVAPPKRRGATYGYGYGYAAPGAARRAAPTAKGKGRKDGADEVLLDDVAAGSTSLDDASLDDASLNGAALNGSSRRAGSRHADSRHADSRHDGSRHADSHHASPNGARRGLKQVGTGRVVTEQEADDQGEVEQDVIDGLEVVAGHWGVPGRSADPDGDHQD